MLYLGEGAKWKSHRGLQLGNSNPDIMKLDIKLLKDCFGVSPKQLTAIVYYRADQNFSQLVEFWSGITKIPKGSFYKSKPDKRTKNKNMGWLLWSLCCYGSGTIFNWNWKQLRKCSLGFKLSEVNCMGR